MDRALYRRSPPILRTAIFAKYGASEAAGVIAEHVVTSPPVAVLLLARTSGWVSTGLSA